MPQEIPRQPAPWTEAHEKAWQDYAHFAREEARRKQAGEELLPEELDAYHAAAQRVDELRILEHPAANIKVKALDRQLKQIASPPISQRETLEQAAAKRTAAAEKTPPASTAEPPLDPKAVSVLEHSGSTDAVNGETDEQDENDRQSKQRTRGPTKAQRKRARRTKQEGMAPENLPIAPVADAPIPEAVAKENAMAQPFENPPSGEARRPDQIIPPEPSQEAPASPPKPGRAAASDKMRRLAEAGLRDLQQAQEATDVPETPPPSSGPEATGSEPVEDNTPQQTTGTIETPPAAAEETPVEEARPVEEPPGDTAQLPVADTTRVPTEEGIERLNRAIDTLGKLTAEERERLETEAKEIYIPNHQWRITGADRARLIREASIKILHEYSPESLERTLHPRETSPEPTRLPRTRGEKPAETPSPETEEVRRMLKLHPALSAERAAELLEKYPDLLPGIGSTRAERIVSAGGEVPPSRLPRRARLARPVAPAVAPTEPQPTPAAEASPPESSSASPGAIETPPRQRPFGEQNLIAEATWSLADRLNIPRGEALERLGESMPKDAPVTRESLHQLVDRLASAPTTPVPAPTVETAPPKPASAETAPAPTLEPTREHENGPWNADDERIARRYADLELTVADAVRRGIRPSEVEKKELNFYRELIDELKLREYPEAAPIFSELDSRLAALPPQPLETVPPLDEGALTTDAPTDGVVAEHPITPPGPIGVPVLDESTLAEQPSTDGLEAEYPTRPARPTETLSAPSLEPTPEAREAVSLWETDQRLSGARNRMAKITAWFSAAANRLWPFGQRAQTPAEAPSPSSEAEIRAMDVSALRIAESKEQPEGRARSQISKDLAWHAGRVAANSLGSIFGVKFAWDAYAYLKEHRAIKNEREHIQIALMEMSRAIRDRRREHDEAQAAQAPKTELHEAVARRVRAFKETVAAARYLSEPERKEYRRRLAEVMARNEHAGGELQPRELDRVGKLARLYLVGKTSGYQVVKQGLNSLLFWGTLAVPGAIALRGVVYPGMAALERAAKSGRAYEKQQLNYGGHSRSYWAKQIKQLGAQAKDLFVVSARETNDDLRGKRGALGRVSALGTLATALGIGGTTIRSFADHTPPETMTQLLDAFERRGMRGVAETSGDNFLKNVSDLSERLHLPRFDRTAEPFAASNLNEAMPVPEPAGSEKIQLSPEAMEHVRRGAVGELTNQQQETVREAARALGVIRGWRGAAEPGALAEALAETPAATIEHGGNVWQAAQTLVAEGKISGDDFARAWEHSVKDLPDLVHPGDVVRFVPGAAGAPSHFEVIPDSNLPTGSAKDLAGIYERLGKEVPDWLKEKTEPNPSLPTQVAAAIEVPPDEFAPDLADIQTDFVRGNLAGQTAAIHQLQDMRESLEFAYRDAAGSPEQTEIREHLERLDAIRHELLYAPEYAAQTRAFESLLTDAAVPEAKRALLKTLTVDRLLAERHSGEFYDLHPLVQRIERYLAIIPSRERPRTLPVETFLQKFVVAGTYIAPA